MIIKTTHAGVINSFKTRLQIKDFIIIYLWLNDNDEAKMGLQAGEVLAKW
jgi:hypothetical protein